LLLQLALESQTMQSLRSFTQLIKQQPVRHAFAAARFFSSPIDKLREPVIGLIAASVRKGSFNEKLVLAAGKVAESKGAKTKVIRLEGEHDLPIFSQDTEAAGFPEAAKKLKEAMAGCDAWIVAGPEYNGFATPLFVNSVAWASRGDPKGEMYTTFKAKTAAIISTSPGGLGGMRGLGSYKELLQNLGVTCLPLSVAVGASFKAFKEDGSLEPGQPATMLDTVITQLYEKARDEANRSVTCSIIGSIKKAQTVGEYGAIPGQKPDGTA